MKVNLTSFILGAALASGGTVAIQAVAAPGDAIYETGGAARCITGAQAACYADCAIADGTWAGARTDMYLVKAYRQPDCDVGKNFAAAVRGVVSAPLVEVPDGSVIRGIVE